MESRVHNKNGLTDTEQIFADHYVLYRNATKAYQAAYPNAAYQTCHSAGHGYYRQEHIYDYVQTRFKEAQERLSVTHERVINELAAMAFFNPADLFNVDGSLIPFHLLPAELSTSIASFECDVYQDETGKIAQGNVKYKFTDKLKALITLARYLNLFEQENENKVSSLAQVLEAVAKQEQKQEQKQLPMQC